MFFKLTYVILQNQNKLKGCKMTAIIENMNLTTKEKKERLANVYGLDVNKLRYFGLYTSTGMLWDYMAPVKGHDGWQKGTKFFCMNDGKVGIL